MQIQIGLVHNPVRALQPITWLGAIIQWFTRKKWKDGNIMKVPNHAVIFVHFRQISLVIHAQAWLKVEKMEVWAAKADRQVMVFDPVQQLGMDDFTWLMEQANLLYDLLNLALWQPIYLVFGRWIGPTGTRQEKAWVCSEIVSRLLNRPRFWEDSPATLGSCPELKPSTLMLTEKGVGITSIVGLMLNENPS